MTPPAAPSLWVLIGLEERSPGDADAGYRFRVVGFSADPSDAATAGFGWPLAEAGQECAWLCVRNDEAEGWTDEADVLDALLRDWRRRPGTWSLCFLPLGTGADLDVLARLHLSSPVHEDEEPPSELDPADAVPTGETS